MVQDSRTSSLSSQQIGHLVAERQHQQELQRYVHHLLGLSIIRPLELSGWKHLEMSWTINVTTLQELFDWLQQKEVCGFSRTDKIASKHHQRGGFRLYDRAVL
jgi:hypothetical protein